MSAHVVYRAARSDDLPAILDVTCRAFGEDVRERMFNQLHHDSSHRLEQSRVADVNGRIVSYVRVSNRPIRYGCASLRMGGIGAVLTLPDYRGQGFASALLEDAAGYMRSAGYHLGILFTGILDFYARLGWVPLAEHTFRLPVPTRPSAHPQTDDTVRRFDVECDLREVERVYDAANAGRVGPHLRDHQYWRDGNARVLGVLPKFVAERDGAVVAYASFRAIADSLWVYEAGCLPKAVDAFPPLAEAIAAEARAAGQTAIECHLPPSHDLLAALRDLNRAPIEPGPPRSMMLRLIDLAGLLRAAAPEFAERLRRSPDSALARQSIGFCVGGQYARIAVQREGVTVDTEPADRVCALDADQFFQLFQGTEPMSDPASGRHGRVVAPADELHIILSALFPPQEPVYWFPDHF